MGWAFGYSFKTPFLEKIFRTQFHETGHGVEVPRCGGDLQLAFEEIVGEPGIAVFRGVQCIDRVVDKPYFVWRKINSEQFLKELWVSLRGEQGEIDSRWISVREGIESHDKTELFGGSRDNRDVRANSLPDNIMYQAL
jgi:hypothetical protein